MLNVSITALLKKARRPLIAVFGAVALMASSISNAEEPFKVGFVYVGPIGDHGWSYQHDQGRQALEKHFGDKVKTTYVENVPEGADAERVIRNLAKSGHKVIFTTSFGFMNPTLKVAAQFPDVVFEHATGYKRTKNVSTYISNTYEGRYVSGYVAAKMSKTGKLGYIASFPIPEVIRDINAVRLAMNKVNPDYELKILWVSSWFDPAKEAEAANVMIDQGVDVILQHTDSPAAMQVAEQRGVYAVGQSSDMSRFGPKAHLVSVVDDWSYHYIHTVQSVMDGTWKPRDYWGGMAEDMILLPEFNKAIPADVVKEAETMIADIKSGKLKPFAGPIYNQKGELKAPAGEELSHEEVAGMNWYVQGIKGEIPH
ncbi:BMP family ABC transporter substrate-binding protein [Hahella sp. KA22]|uniref:BMP family ABC transporter substrate-binding protein n=1 Tax=Hahella sp. KA22 TaxID=1628392 RepID=UPI000FDF154B|nr:BMP family ABC transporter substrate-binding protein [Hahella sp. KA22]AZZ93913.1 BMP family ABC transporter substrate-binding protein [Hahella sp. KA22]QAY57287.1 BMP family ABC transporter substrate-binding protein [Hahella sp. KA22]